MLRIAFSAGGALLLAGLIASAASADISGNTNTSSQVVTNASASEQASAAASGAADSTGAGVATSGAAVTETVFEGLQANVAALLNQTSAAEGDVSGNENTAAQTSTNALGNDQANGAISGGATAADSGSSTSGEAASGMYNVQEQIAAIIQANQSILPEIVMPTAP